MDSLTELLRLLDATAADRWRAGHHAAVDASDPVPAIVADRSRLALAGAWRAAMDHVNRLAAVPPELRPYAVSVAEQATQDHIVILDAAYHYWLTGE